MRSQTSQQAQTSASNESGQPRDNAPRVDEIVAWIVKNSELSLEYEIKQIGTGFDNLSSSIQSDNDNPCLVGFKAYRHWIYYDHEGIHDGRPASEASEYTDDKRFGVNLARLDPEAVKTFSIEGVDKEISGPTKIVLSTTDRRNVVLVHWQHESYIQTRGEEKRFIGGDPFDKPKLLANEVEFFVRDSDWAARYTKALRDAITACGGKPSVGNIY